MKKLFKVFFTCVLGLAMFFNSSGQETVYVCADIGSTPIHSYGVSGTTLITPPVIQNVPYVGGGPVGLAIDEANGILFVCYEFSNTINMLDAVTMLPLGSTNAPGAVDLSGLTFDPVLSKLYSTDRETNKFYSFSWNPTTYVLTNDFLPQGYIFLPGPSGLLTPAVWDITLDHVNNILYCSDRDNSTVNYYNTSNFQVLAGFYSVGIAPMGIDIDLANQIIYITAGFDGGYVGVPIINKYVIGGSETSFTIPLTSGWGVFGVAVNQSSGYVYITTGNQWHYSPGTGPNDDKVLVMNPLNGNITWSPASAIGEPTAVLYTGQGYNPLALTKNAAPGCFMLGQNLTYTITYTNNNPAAVTGVLVSDTLPANVTLVSATGSPTVSGQVLTWNVGPLSASAGGSFTVVVTVNSGDVVNNVCTINSNETGLVIVTEQTDICAPSVPLSDWAVYILIALIGISIWFRYQRRIA